jgi:serine/threonine protein kinase
MTLLDMNSPGGDINQKYQLLAKIGRGGMGDVFLATQKSAVQFNRLVVVKRIHNRHDQDSDVLIDRFIGEANLVASLNHPHIVKIYDIYKSHDAISIVMEYVEGETLKYLFTKCNQNQQRIPFGVTARMILDACDALHYAHSSTSPVGEARTVIHQDIGLHNLMLDTNGYLKVIDFGIARSNAQMNPQSQRNIEGTPAYMAPEMLQNNSPDHRVDIYALGLCLYELATQHRSFNFTGKFNPEAVLKEITQRQLKLPSMLQSDLPEGIDEVIFKAIDNDPSNRYQTIDAFAADLNLVAGRSVVSCGDVKKWFTAEFATRVVDRRAFGARMLKLSEKKNISRQRIPEAIPNPETDSLPPVKMVSTSPPGAPPAAGNRDTTPSRPSTGGSFRKPLIGAAAALLVGAIIAVLYIVLVQGQSSASSVSDDPSGTEADKATANLQIFSNPADAVATLNHRKLGSVGAKGLKLHIAENRKHTLTISKAGYEDYSLSFVGPSNTLKRIDAVLVPASAVPTASDSMDASGGMDTGLNTTEKKPDPGSLPSSHASGTRTGRSTVRTHVKKKETAVRRAPVIPARDDAETMQKPTAKKEKSVKIDPSGASRKVPLPDDDVATRRVPLVD